MQPRRSFTNSLVLATTCILVLVASAAASIVQSQSPSCASAQSDNSVSALASTSTDFPRPSPQQYARWFKAFRLEYGKGYQTSAAESERFAIFKSNVDFILEHERNPNRTFTMKINQFADMTHSEFVATRNRLQPLDDVAERLRSNNQAVFPRKTLLSLPNSVNWTSKCTPVKNQGQCGSCWAHSAVEAVESAYAIENNCDPFPLSVQELVDCSGPQGNEGCAGGLMDQAFEYIISAKGLCNESAYPYHAVDGKCNATQCRSSITITSFKDVPKNNELQLQAAVAQQPVSVAVDASAMLWQFYSGGVVPSSQCGTQLDHGVVAIGYGDLNGKPYWLVRNSWGTSWGLKGMILLERTSSTSSPGTCGIAMVASFPTGATKLTINSSPDADTQAAGQEFDDDGFGFQFEVEAM